MKKRKSWRRNPLIYKNKTMRNRRNQNSNKLYLRKKYRKNNKKYKRNKKKWRKKNNYQYIHHILQKYLINIMHFINYLIDRMLFLQLVVQPRSELLPTKIRMPTFHTQLNYLIIGTYAIFIIIFASKWCTREVQVEPLMTLLKVHKKCNLANGWFFVNNLI